MINILHFLLKSNKAKKNQIITSENGFTLIELLIALAIAFLIITPMLGFMISVLNTDQNEQAKSNAEQELQTALDYISRDLQQALYIYDETGLNAIKSQLPDANATDRVPILVFWKREYVPKAIDGRDDTFVYSLVAYYLIKDNQQPWSKAARIARWQIKDGVSTTSKTSFTNCGTTSRYVPGYCPDAGFARFSIEQALSIESGMNQWTKSSTAYNIAPSVLIDYIDQTPINEVPTQDQTKLQPVCPVDQAQPNRWSLITPAKVTSGDLSNITGFYVCVDRASINDSFRSEGVDRPNPTAKIFLRGNGLARLDRQSSNVKKYSKSQDAFFPTASVIVEVQGYLSR
jgi:type II secretory pathway pseudopilin PulG